MNESTSLNGQERPKVAAVYVRVSTSRQEAENQKLQLLPHCEKNGYQVYQIYSDIMSGAEDHRPAFNRMFKDAHLHKFDLVLFWSLDRFSRSGLDFTVQKLKELSNAGVAWESYSEPYIKTIGPFGDVVLALMATLAKVERQRISDRTRVGIARKRLTGWVPGRKKGVKDKKPRKRRGYYGQQNWAGTKKGVSPSIPQNIPETIRDEHGMMIVSNKNKDALLAGQKARLKVDLTRYNPLAVEGVEVTVLPGISALGERFAKVVLADGSQMDIVKEELKDEVRHG